jgi:hypothetical protein
MTKRRIRADTASAHRALPPKNKTRIHPAWRRLRFQPGPCPQSPVIEAADWRP